MVLQNDSLSCYDDDFSLDAPKQFANPTETKGIVETIDKKSGQKLLHVETTNDNDWVFHWEERVSSGIVESWAKKFRYLNAELQSGRARAHSVSGGSGSKKGRRKSVFGF